MNDITKHQLENCVLQHQHGGYGLVMVEDIDAEFCRVAAFSRTGIESVTAQVFLAWKKKLTTAQIKINDEITDEPISDKALASINELRSKIKSGQLIARNQRLVSAQ